jgi:hypothetical protein
MLVWTVEFSCRLILVRPGVLGLLLAILVTYSGDTTWWKKADLHHDGGNTEYGHCTVKQTYENVFKHCC